MIRVVALVFFLLVPGLGFAKDKVLNIYGWAGEIPSALIKKFEHETGIRVNFSSYDNNETLYAKLHASTQPIYDIVVPSAYFVERLKKQGFLKALDKTRLPYFKNIEPEFLDPAYDAHNAYSVPMVWGATGIFYNQKWIESPPKTWADLWDETWRAKLMLLDDPREVFAMALLSLGYSPNDENPKHLEAAFQHLKALNPNVKLFASESIQAIMIDEDALVGLGWNGDASKAHAENPNIDFVYPKEGFVIWVDCLAILNNAPHSDEAYQFIDFMLKAENAAIQGQSDGYAITNAAGKALLPEALQKNPMVYPSPEILKRGIVQRDASEENLELYNTYWQKLKFSF